MVVLLVVAKEDIYGYELVQKVNEVVAVNEGTIYPLLKRLTNEKFFESYYEISSEGPQRKYYRITKLGKERSKELFIQWRDFSDSINNFLKGWDIYG